MYYGNIFGIDKISGEGEFKGRNEGERKQENRNNFERWGGMGAIPDEKSGIGGK